MNIYDNPYYDAMVNPKTPRLGIKSLYPNFPIVADRPFAPQYGAEFIGKELPYLKELIPTTDMATGVVPLLKEDEEEDLEGLFAEGMVPGIPNIGSIGKAPTAFGTMRRKGGGISDLFRALVGFAVPGAGLLMGGFDGIRSLNQRLQGSTFGQSRSMQEFLERKRNERLGNVDSRGMGLSRSELVQRNFADRVRDLSDAGDDDRGRPGGFGSGAGSFKESEPTATEGSF